MSESINLPLAGLRKSIEEAETHDTSVEIDQNASFHELWRKLTELGYLAPDGIGGRGRFYQKISYTKDFHDARLVEVVDDKAKVDKNHVYIDEPLAACSNRDQKVHFDILDGVEDSYSDQPTNNIQVDEDLTMLFHRTVRMPDDNRLHSLPASLGSFPLYNVADHAERLPGNILEKGGVFLPMWQREALWIEFNSTRRRPYAIRVYIGQINAVTGDNMTDKGSCADAQEPQQQDYVVVPGQDWIDGVCVSPGVVRQFVAMPLGSGYTVEGQKTGEEKHGGLQIEVIPSYISGLAKWLAEDEEKALLNPGLYLDETKTPRELGLRPGVQIKSYPPVPTYERPCMVKDLVKFREGVMLPAQTLYVPRPRRHPEISTNSAQPPMAQSPNTSRLLVLPPPQPPSAPPPSTFPTEILGTWGPGRGLPWSRSSDSDGNGPQRSSDIDSNRVKEYKIGYYTKSVAEDEAVITPEGVNGLLADQKYLEATEGTQSESLRLQQQRQRSTDQSLNIRAMGLAAGGKMVQDIIRDNNPPTIWNTAASRVIHVHILDPVSCEEVTHVVPPPVPLSAQDAVASDLPFFVVEEQVDNRLDGGDFDQVHSVSQMDKINGVSSEPSLDPSKPTMCKSCEKRLCDCIVRPCNHQFCNVCIRVLETEMDGAVSRQAHCPRCKEGVSRVAGFSAPMNLPGEESVRVKMPVQVLKANDGRMEFQSVRQTRI